MYSRSHGRARHLPPPSNGERGTSVTTEKNKHPTRHPRSRRAAIAGGEESRRQGKAVEIYVQARNGNNLILKAGHETH